MGRCQTETSYLKSVLLWLQEYWTEPDPPRIYLLKRVEGGSRHSSARRTHAAFKSARRDNRSARVLATPKVVAMPTANKSQSGKEKESRMDSVAECTKQLAPEHTWTFRAK
jgi:hypothetical protein